MIEVGSYAETVAAGDIALTSLGGAVSSALSLVRRFQSGFYKNARAVIYGKPVGEPEVGQPDLDTDVKDEKVYATLDTPQPRLVFQLRRANRKPPAVDPNANFMPLDPTPETEAALPAVSE